MNSKWIENIGVAVGAITEHRFSERADGLYWQSSGHNAEAVEYDAELVAGLHIGCGLTRSLRSRAAFGELSIEGAGATVIICTEPIMMRTEVARGSFQSAGLSVSPKALKNVGILSDAVHAFGTRCIVLPRVPTSIAVALSAPVDDWYQGAARELVHEARTVELIGLLEQSLADHPRTTGKSSKKSAALAMEAKDYIDQNLVAPLSLVALSARLACSPRTLTAAFRETIGMSIGTYVTERRLGLGALLLREGLGPTEVAYSVGYTPSHFTTAFRRKFGMPPSARN